MAAWFENKDNNLAEDIAIEIDKEKFIEMLNLALCVASTGKQNNLRGIFIQIRNNIIRLVSTDGWRLLITESSISCQDAQRRNFFIPFEAAFKIKQDSPGKYRKIHINIRDNEIVFEYSYVYELQAGVGFPEYEKIIPQAFKNKVYIGARSFFSALTRLKSYTDTDQFHKIILDLSLNKLSVSVPNSRYQESLSIDYLGPKLRIGFNINFFLDIIEKLPTLCNKLCLEFNSQNQPLVIRWQDYIYVVIPVQI